MPRRKRNTDRAVPASRRTEQHTVRVTESEKVAPGLEIEAVAKLLDLPLDQATGTPADVSLGDDGMSMSWGYSRDSGEVFYAAVVPNKLTDNVGYLDEIEKLEVSTQSTEADFISAAWKLYEREGYVGTSVDVLVENAVSGNGFITGVEDENAKILLKAWLKRVNSFSMYQPGKKSAGSKATPEFLAKVGGAEAVQLQAIMHALVAGMWVASVKWENVEVPELGGKFNLPTYITTYDNTTISPSSAAAALGVDVFYWTVPNDVKSAIEKPGDSAENKLIAENVPDWVAKLIKAGETQIPLPAKFTLVLKNKQRDYSPYGTSYVKRFFGPVADKARLRALDRATVAGLIQRLTIVMLGMENEKHPYSTPTPARFNLLRRALKNLKTDMFMVWGGPDIAVKDIGPDGKVLDFGSRYDEVNRDLRKASGLSSLLTEGEAKSGDDFIVFRATLAKVEGLRASLRQIFDRLLREICVENGFEDIYPTYNFRANLLRDDRTVKTQTLKGWEDGLLPRAMSLSEMGYDADEVIAAHLREKESGIDEKIGPPPVAYSTNKAGQGQINNEPGRPNNSNENDTRDNAQKTDSSGGNVKNVSIRSSEEDDDVETDEEATDHYLDEVKSVFAGVVAQILSGDIANKEKFLVSVQGAFAAFVVFVNDLIDAELDREGLHPNDAVLWAIKVKGWNAHYLARFEKQIEAIVIDNWGSSNFIEFLAAALGVMAASRVPLYVTETRKKIEATVIAATAKSQSKLIRRRSSGSERVCSHCESIDGALMTPEEFWEDYPSHVNCECSGEIVDTDEDIIA